MESPNDLRYETLIKIISSASVGCRGAYTTASRECNDLNGNNSVKDGCSRPCKYVGGASMPLPAFRSARIERKKGRGGDTVGRRKQSCTGDIVIWALDSRPRTATITPGTRTLDARGEQEFSRNSRTAERSKCARSGKRGIAGREPVAISPPSRKKAKRCSRSRAKYGARCVSRDDRPRWRGTNRARTSFASSILLLLLLFLSARYNAITERATFHVLPTSPRNRIRHYEGEREGGESDRRDDHRVKIALSRERLIFELIVLIGEKKAGFDRVSRNWRRRHAISRESAANATKEGRARIRIMDDGRHRYKRPTFPGRRKL